MFRSLGQFCYKGKPSWRINGLLMPIHTSNLYNLRSEATCSMSEKHATFFRRWTWIPGVRALLLLSTANLTTYKREFDDAFCTLAPSLMLGMWICFPSFYRRMASNPFPRWWDVMVSIEYQGSSGLFHFYLFRCDCGCYNVSRIKSVDLIGLWLRVC